MIKIPTATKTVKTHTNRQSGTREALLITAMKEFSGRGIAGTSVNQLTRASGAKNRSAIHYHFGSKAGLVSALINFVQNWFDRQRNDDLVVIESKVSQGKDITVTEILQAIVRTYQHLIESEPWGLAAIRFIALIEFDENPEAWQALYQQSSRAADRVLTLMIVAAPDVNDDSRKKRVLYFFGSIIYGFSSYKHLKISYYGDQEASSLTDLTEFYIRCGEKLFK